MYAEGQGVPQDNAEAVKWYRRAAEQNDAMAQHNLGHAYRTGKGVPQDTAEAVKWLRTAAEQGHDGAQCDLGVIYGKGRGVPQDYVLAHMWFRLAAAQGNEKAVQNRDLAEKRMTPVEMLKAERLAREWLEKHPR